MKMRKGLVLVIALIAVASLMAAMAYSTAMVESKTLGAIVATDEAFLAIVENPAFDDFAKIDDTGKMVIDFTANNTSGFQPASSYTFNDLFYLKNNLSDPIKVGLRFNQVYQNAEWIPGLWRVEAPRNLDGMPAGDASYPQALMRGQSAASTFSSGWFEGRYIILQPGEQIGLDWLFSVGATAALDLNKTIQLQVHAEKVTTTTP